ncbi:MAG TPA: PEGA domain-containing protein [Vicinamibacterales bacterium]|nr:PEGA domain-containing protein [Vicinamibacterales bacterium]
MALLKRIIYICALAAASVAWAGSASAQVIVAGRFHVPHVYVGVYDPFLFDPWWGLADAQWGPYPYPYPYPFRRAIDPGASVRLEVKPKEAEVYVDGYYAGIVDDFDGVFQRLRVPPGEHEILLYLDGYRTTTQRVYLEPDKTFRIKYTMERLGANESQEPRPMPPPPPPGQAGQPGQEYPPQPGAPPQPGQPRPMPPVRVGPPMRMPPPPPQNAPAQNGAEAYGTLSIRVQPADAEILIDGQVWRGPATSDRLVVDVADGKHSVEIRKAGYIGYVTEVQVRRGETTPLNVSLRTQHDQ